MELLPQSLRRADSISQYCKFLPKRIKLNILRSKACPGPYWMGNSRKMLNYLTYCTQVKRTRLIMYSDTSKSTPCKLYYCYNSKYSPFRLSIHHNVYIHLLCSTITSPFNLIVPIQLVHFIPLYQYNLFI